MRKRGTKKAGSNAPAFKLPTRKTRALTKLGDYTLLVYGDKKIGKTSLAAQFPNAIFLACEPGTKALEVYEVPVTDWRTFKEAVKSLRTDTSFDTVVIDTADEAYRMATEFACAKLAIDHPSDEEWGKGWAAVRVEFTREVNKLLSMGKGVIFISHATEKNIKRRSGSDYDKILPSMPNAASNIMEALVDVWAFYTYEHGARVLVVRGDDHIGAGMRLQGHFLDTNGKPLTEVPMGDSAEEAYANLLSAFANKLRPASRSTDTKKPQRTKGTRRKTRLRSRS